jgi:hypothetical protein
MTLGDRSHFFRFCGAGRLPRAPTYQWVFRSRQSMHAATPALSPSGSLARKEALDHRGGAVVGCFWAEAP